MNVPSKSKLRVLDLFSGIGGFSLGFERTGGFETVALCEIAPYPRKVLARRWPDVHCHPNVITREFKEGEADVVCGGFPCQDLSEMGKRAGLAGPSSGLWRELLRAIRMVRPRYAIVENVAEITSGPLGEILGDLASIRHDAEWHCIPAGAVNAPHERDRIWIAAHPASEPGLHQSDAWENSKRLPDYGTAWAPGSWDEATSRVCRVDDGIPDRVDRTSSLGNSVVPQIPEMIGRAILQARAA